MRRLLLLFALALSSAAYADGERPNVVLFVTDDQSPDAGCYGNPVLRTPNLDALAASGTRFTQAFATTASCSASRSVILTGIHNHANGQYGHVHTFHHFETFRAMAAVSLPLQLEHLGYRTARIGKYHVAPEPVYHFGADLKGPERDPVKMAANCEAFLKEPGDKPFFLYFCTADPHRSESVDPASTLQFKPDLFGNPPGRASRPGDREMFCDPKDVIVPEFLPDTPESRAELAAYYQSCSRADRGLGRLIELLKEAGKWENTVIVYTADHGMAFPGAKTTVYDAGLRVPFVVRDPRAANTGVVNGAMISHVDLTPSILDLAGGYDPETHAPKAILGVPAGDPMENAGKIPRRYQGRSWAGILGDADPAGWDSILASHTFHEIQMYYPMRAVRGRQYKLIWNLAHDLPFPFATDLWSAATWQSRFRQGPETSYGHRTVESYIRRPEFELFDIRKDPSESHNLAADPEFAETLRTYKARLKEAQEQTGDPWISKWSHE